MARNRRGLRDGTGPRAGSWQRKKYGAMGKFMRKYGYCPRRKGQR